MSDQPTIDPTTGEVLDTVALPTEADLIARERISDMADGLLSLERTIARLEEEARGVRILADEAKGQITAEILCHRALLTPEGDIMGQEWALRYVPPRKDGSRSVNREAIKEHAESLPPQLQPREVLPKPVLRWPTIADLERHLGDILIAGLALHDLVDEPGWTEPTVEIVARGGAA